MGCMAYNIVSQATPSYVKSEKGSGQTRIEPVSQRNAHWNAMIGYPVYVNKNVIPQIVRMRIIHSFIIETKGVMTTMMAVAV